MACILSTNHNRKSRYLKTQYYVENIHVVNGDDIHIDFIVDYLAADLKKYRKRILEIQDIDLLSVDDVKDMITNDSKDVDIIAFIDLHIEKLLGQNREKTAKPFVTVRNSLKDYVKGMLFSSKVTSKFLNEYEEYLRKPKRITRSIGKTLVTKETSVNDKGIHNHMAAFRTLFNEAKRHYNDENTGKIIIKNNPFSKYKIMPKKNKKHKNLDIETIRLIRDFTPTTSREHLQKIFSCYHSTCAE